MATSEVMTFRDPFALRVSVLMFVGAAVLAGCGAAAPPQPRTYLPNSDVRITEINFDPSPTQGEVEFIELANVETAPAQLGGWQVTGAGRIVLPAGTTLNPGDVAVLCKDTAALKRAFGNELSPIATFVGKLKGSGETVRLEDPTGKVADEVSYSGDQPAAKEASDTGRSLHRTTFDRNGNWSAADPTPGKWKPNQ